jgi:AcrR family transcriptional regulator
MRDSEVAYGDVMTVQRESPRLYAKGIAKREAILDAALVVFGSAGFHGASLREIARQCGVSHQSLMHYFPSKELLLMAVLRRRDERLRRHFGDPGGLNLQELVSLAEDNAGTPGVIELFSMASAEATTRSHPAHAYYAEFYAEIVSSAARYLEFAEANRLLRPGVTAKSAARIVLAVQDGLQLQWLYDSDAVQVAALMRTTLEALITVPLDEFEVRMRGK